MLYILVPLVASRSALEYGIGGSWVGRLVACLRNFLTSLERAVGQLTLDLEHWLAVPSWHVSTLLSSSPLSKFVAPASSHIYLREPCQGGFVLT